ncbi:hypothetical protein PISMIDRAFT_678626, partial [Pisolithus microcarpus 441]
FETIFDAIFDQNLGVIVDGRMSVANTSRTNLPTRRLRERRRREIAKTNRWIGLRDLFME